MPPIKTFSILTAKECLEYGIVISVVVIRGTLSTITIQSHIVSASENLASAIVIFMAMKVVVNISSLLITNLIN